MIIVFKEMGYAFCSSLGRLICPDFGNCHYLKLLQFRQILPPNKYNKNNRLEISQIDGGPPLSAVLSFTARGGRGEILAPLQYKDNKNVKFLASLL
jgi:hypothetical protein